MTESFTPLLTTTDWNAEWMQLQKARRHRDSAVYWNERAKTFTSKDYPNPYVSSFLERAGVAPEESVFDMGCGTGALALPLGEAGIRPRVSLDWNGGHTQQRIVGPVHVRLRRRLVERHRRLHVRLSTGQPYFAHHDIPEFNRLRRLRTLENQRTSLRTDRKRIQGHQPVAFRIGDGAGKRRAKA